MGARDTKAFESDELLALARVALDKDDIEGALYKLKQVTEAANPPVEAFALAAKVYAQLRLFDRAETLYDRFLQKQPDAFVERFQMGMVSFDSGKADKALEIWESVLKDQPGFPPALFYKALALSQKGKLGDAKQLLESLLKSLPTDNLYFGRAKELLHAIESGQLAAPKGGNGSDKAAARSTPTGGAYRTEH
jgi:tetratricopeptide (TPR) repeat protein